jgi:hypothetical protein
MARTQSTEVFAETRCDVSQTWASAPATRGLAIFLPRGAAFIRARAMEQFSTEVVIPRLYQTLIERPGSSGRCVQSANAGSTGRLCWTTVSN